MVHMTGGIEQTLLEEIINDLNLNKYYKLCDCKHLLISRCGYMR